jgi:tetratricopeptide (TPR) repeat protein
MAVFAAVTVVALARLRTRPALAVVWFAYLALAAPYFGLTEARHMASDRYACLLTVLPAALLALAAARVRPPPARVAVAAAGAAAAAALAALTWNQLGIWRSDRIQHRAVLPGLVNPGLRDDFKSRMLILDFMRGDEADSGAAVEAWLRDHPSSGGFRTAMGIIAEKRRIASYYGRVGYLAILQEQEALQFARAGELFEADEHFKEALRLDGRFYQAAFDRALVLLQLGRSDEALRCFLQAERWAPGPLPTGESRGFVYGLERLADLEGDGRLAKAAARALER